MHRKINNNGIVQYNGVMYQVFDSRLFGSVITVDELERMIIDGKATESQAVFNQEFKVVEK